MRKSQHLFVIAIALAGALLASCSGTSPTATPTAPAVGGDHASLLLRDGDEAFGRADYSGAIELYSQAIALKPDSAEAYNNRGLAHYRLTEIDEALANYNMALQLRPDYVNALTNRAIALFDHGEFDAVIADTTRAIELDPNDDSAFMFRGNAEQRLGSWTAAFADWLAARRIRTTKRSQ